ncbi:MAG: ABC transporter ATP-binding protein [Clostridiales bacterium]|nr:ABC transporter ATP-binding protein [Clostridiales bacterium]HBM80439.1 hypothetical protein [Clostridiaceae bacterium]
MLKLKINNLTMAFGGIIAVSNVSMAVEEGLIAGLIGPNGAGKTTLFNVMTGMYSPTSGTISYKLRGKDIAGNKLKPYQITKCGISRTFQNIRLFKDMTVLDNVRLAFHDNIKCGVMSSILRLPSFYSEEERIYKEATELLNVFKLADKKNEFARNLPYGEQRRLEIARALAAKPEILLLDEPAAGMNPNETKQLMGLIKWVRDKYKLTIILIEHDMSLVMNICEKVFVLDYGQLIAEGAPKEVQKNKKVIEAYLGGKDYVKA